MPGNPTVVVDFVANTRDLSNGVSQASRQTSGFGSTIKSMGKTAALAAGAAGVGALVATLKIGIDEYAETQKVAAQTNAVIKSTGGVANVTAKHVSSLAESIMKKTGIDDEAVASGENMLLTFTNIRNEVGKGNDIFDQSTRLMTDMSVALGQDMKSSAMQLGKALNDPVKGMTALQRVGVSFTDGQKKQVAAMVESGNTLGAQKLILKELNKEFGGSAEAAGKTLPGQLNILKQTFNNLAGELIAKLVPILKITIAWLRDHWPQVSAAFQAMWANLKPLLEAFGALVAQTAKFIADNWSTIGPVVIGMAKMWTLGFRIMGGAVQVLVALLRGDWSAAWRAFKNTVEAVLNTVKGLITAFFNLYKTVITAAWNAMKSATSSAWGDVRQTVRDAVERVKDFLRGMVDWISDLGRGVLAGALSRVGNMFDRIADGARDAYRAVREVLNDMASFVGGMVDRVGNAAGRIADAIKRPLNALFSAIDSVKITVPRISIPSIKIAGKRIGGGSLGGFTIDPFLNMPRLAAGGIVTGPTVALLGEAGPEAVVPLSGAGGMAPIEVRVFIGDQELRGLVRTEIRQGDNRTAQVLLTARGAG